MKHVSLPTIGARHYFDWWTFMKEAKRIYTESIHLYLILFHVAKELTNQTQCRHATTTIQRNGDLYILHKSQTTCRLWTQGTIISIADVSMETVRTI